MALTHEAEPSIVLWEASRAMADFLQDNNIGITVGELAAGIESPDVKSVYQGPVLGGTAGSTGAVGGGSASIPDALYGRAMSELRPRLQLAYATAFRESKLDAMCFPCTPLHAQPIASSDETVTHNGRQLSTFLTFVRNTRPAAVAGLPAITICGGMAKSEPQLPVGLELDGPAFSDRSLLAVALAIEQQLAGVSGADKL